MAKIVLIIGPSGSGKSTSMRNFKEDELTLINVVGKDLPFPKKFKSMAVTDNYEQVIKDIGRTKNKAIVVDDAGYLITNYFMKNHSNGGNKFDFYDNLGTKFWALLYVVADDTKVAKDKIVYFIMHETSGDTGRIRPKTIGKMLDDRVCVEGLFSIVLRSSYNNGKYVFKTHTDGYDVAKTPIGMFEEEEIDNDLKAVDQRIREYYNLDKEEK